MLYAYCNSLGIWILRITSAFVFLSNKGCKIDTIKSPSEAYFKLTLYAIILVIFLITMTKCLTQTAYRGEASSCSHASWQRSLESGCLSRVGENVQCRFYHLVGGGSIEFCKKMASCSLLGQAKSNPLSLASPPPHRCSTISQNKVTMWDWCAHLTLKP